MTVASSKAINSLIDVCRYSLDRSAKPSHVTVDEHLMFAAISNKTESLIAAAENDGVLKLSEEARSSLQLFQAFKKAKNSYSASSALIAQSAMDQAKIECVHFKGTVFQWFLYGNPFHRLSSDADILVQETAFKSAAEALKSKGLKRRHHGSGFWWEHFLEELHFDDEQGNCNVDLHKGIKQPGIPRFDDIGGILRRSNSIKFLGRDLQVPCLSDIYAILLINFAKALLNRQSALCYLLDLLTLASKTSRQANDLALRDLPQSLRPVLRLCIHTAAVLFGSVKGIEEWTRYQDLRISDQDLLAAVFPSQLDEGELPRRRELLKLFHAGHAANYLQEVWNLASSEILRRSSHS